MVIVAIMTGGDKELSDKVFKIMSIKQAQRKRILEKVKNIPERLHRKSVFIEDIEIYRKEIKQTNKFRWIAQSRQHENLILYTCKRFKSIPIFIGKITDFFFYPIQEKNIIKFFIFRSGFLEAKTNIEKTEYYVKTYYCDWNVIKSLKVSDVIAGKYKTEAIKSGTEA